MSPLTAGLAAVCVGLGGAASFLLVPAGPPPGPGVARLPVTVAVPVVSPDSGDPATDNLTSSRMWLRAQQADVVSPPPLEAGLGRRDLDRAEGVDNTRGYLDDSGDASRYHR